MSDVNEREYLVTKIENTINRAGGNGRLLAPHVASSVALIGGEVLEVNAAGEVTGRDLSAVIASLKADEELAPAWNARGPGDTRELKRSAMSTAERCAYIEKHGSEKYLELPL